MTLAQSSRLRIVTFSGLYLVQGIPTGFITITLAAFLADKGYSAGAVAQLMALNYVPWGAKVLYGPCLDRYKHSKMGRQRPWLLTAQSGMLLSLGVLFAVPGVQIGIWPIAGIVFVYNLFGALQDVATDALAVGLLDADEYGFVSGTMWSSKIVGIAIGGAGMGTVLSKYGWKPAIGIQLVFLLGAILLPLLVRERPSDHYLAWPVPDDGGRALPDDSTFESVRDVVGQIVDTFRRSRESILALLALLAAVPTRMMVTFGPVFTVQSLGWSDVWYSQFAGGPALVAGGIGAVLGGWLADRVGRRRVVWTALVGIMGLFLLFGLSEPWWGTAGVVVSLFLLGMFVDMVLRMALQAIYMATTRDAIMATQFTIYMTLGNMSNVLGSLLITPLDALFSAQSIFFWSAGFGVIPLLLLYWLPEAKEHQKAASAGPSTTADSPGGEN